MSIIEELNEHEKRQLEIMDFYNSGYTYEEIAKFMFMSVNTIKTIVNTWIKKLPTTSQDFIRLRHKIEKNAKKETIKAINYEATKEMGNKAFILKNRSIYKTRENGNIVLKSKEELGCSVTWDTPKNLINDSREEKREEFTIQDLIYFGLSADPKAKVRRELLGKELRIGYGNANQVLSRLNNYGITKEEFVKAIEKIEKMI